MPFSALSALLPPPHPEGGSSHGSCPKRSKWKSRTLPIHSLGGDPGPANGPTRLQKAQRGNAHASPNACPTQKPVGSLVPATPPPPGCISESPGSWDTLCPSVSSSTCSLSNNCHGSQDCHFQPDTQDRSPRPLLSQSQNLISSP